MRTGQGRSRHWTSGPSRALQPHILDQLLDEGLAASVAPGIVAAVTNRERTIYARAVGLSSVAARRELHTESVFRIASMTKPLTSLGVMLLAEAGRIDLDRPFAEYVAGYRQPEVLESFDPRTRSYATHPADRPVTIRQLLTHTSGYGYWFLDAALLALTSGPPDLLNPPFLMHEPGIRFAYGTSTDVLGQIFEPVTGMPLERFLRARIFEPLGMQDTGYVPPADAARLVNVHARRGAGFEELPNETEGAPPRGGGGLYSTAGDYLAFLRLLLNEGDAATGRIASAAHVRAMTQNQIGDLFVRMQTTALPSRTNDFAFLDGTQKFGFGVMIETRDRPGGRPAGSFGWAGIYNTYFWADARAGLAAVVLMQTSPFSDPVSLAFYEQFERAVYAQPI